jgi:hypothetical protein
MPEQTFFGVPEIFPFDKDETYAMGRIPTNRMK